MKVIILLAGYGTRMRPHTWSRPKPLLKVAGNTVVGHLLDLMHEITIEEVIFVVGYRGEQIESWIRQNYPDLNVKFVVQEEAKGQAHAVWLCKEYLQDDNEVMIAFGDGVVEAAYGDISDQGVDADAVFLVKEVEDPRRFGVVVLDDDGYITQFVEKPSTMEHRLAIAGIYWFKSSVYLFKALNTIIHEKRKTLGEYFMADAFQVMLEQKAKLKTMLVEQWADAGTPGAILQTNARLLAVGFASQDALERSYSEGFTVIPPVFIHPTAEIDAALIGPHASIDADVKISNAVVRNSIIDTGAEIDNCVLESALVGERAKVSGRGKALFVGDNSFVDLG
jgi:glucose-1-phosphate thymidylyltransferase